MVVPDEPLVAIRIPFLWPGKDSLHAQLLSRRTKLSIHRIHSQTRQTAWLFSIGKNKREWKKERNQWNHDLFVKCASRLRHQNNSNEAVLFRYFLERFQPFFKVNPFQVPSPEKGSIVLPNCLLFIFVFWPVIISSILTTWKLTNASWYLHFWCWTYKLFYHKVDSFYHGCFSFWISPFPSLEIKMSDCLTVCALVNIYRKTGLVVISFD